MTCEGGSAGLPLTAHQGGFTQQISPINPLIPADALSLEPNPKSSVNKNINGAWQGEKWVIIHNIWGLLILSLLRSGAAFAAGCQQHTSFTCKQNAGYVKGTVYSDKGRTYNDKRKL